VPIDAADILVDNESLASRDRETPGIIAAVLERLKGREHRFADVRVLTNVAKYPTHTTSSLAAAAARCVTPGGRILAGNLDQRFDGTVERGIRLARWADFVGESPRRFVPPMTTV
jgi:hypothetical protein